MNILVIGGMGHIGLPLALTLSHAGHHVDIYDTNREALDAFASEGALPFYEPGLDKLDVRNIRVTYSVDGKAPDVTFIAFGPTIDKYGKPEPKFYEQVEEYLAVLTGIVAFRGTLCIGDIARFKQHYKTPNLIAYCPERLAEGQALKELTTLPQIIGCDDTAVASMLRTVFSSIGVTSLVVNTKEAEFIKLMTNFYRYAHFGIANLLYRKALELGLDYGRIFAYAKYCYPRLESLPGPGWVGGYCLRKDSLFFDFDAGLYFMAINEGLADQVAEHIVRTRNPKKVGIYGLGFKKGSDDTRESVVFRLKAALEHHGVSVVLCDSLIPEYASNISSLADCDLIIDGNVINLQNIDSKVPWFSVWNGDV